MDGFLLIDKPAGPTSFAVVKHVRSFCRRCKIGHAGTLDPAASGLLIVALGNATRLLEFLPTEPKVYTFIVSFGSETDTLDAEGRVTRSGGRIPGEDEIRSVLPRFVGKQMQVPPRFSALKIKGKRAYDLARGSEDFTLAPRSSDHSFAFVRRLSCGQSRGALHAQLFQGHVCPVARARHRRGARHVCAWLEYPPHGNRPVFA